MGDTLISRALGLSVGDEALLSSAWDGQRSLAPSEAFALQEAFVHLHRFMFQHKLLPMSLIGVERSQARGSAPLMLTAPDGGVRRDWNWSRMDDEVLSRRGFIKFIQHNAPLVRAVGPRSLGREGGGALCLGWDDFTYVRLPQLRCDLDRSMSFRYATNASVKQKNQEIRANLDVHTIDDLSQRVRGRFDLILCNQVFEHVAKPPNAARLLYHLLKPRGLIFWTAPFIEPYHQVPEDHFRYTHVGAAKLFRDAGLVPIREQKIGDTELATGYLLGFGVQDFDLSLSDKLVNSRMTGLTHNLWEGSYISSALVLQRPV